MSQRVIIACKPKSLDVSVGKPSLNRARACELIFFEKQCNRNFQDAIKTNEVYKIQRKSFKKQVGNLDCTQRATKLCQINCVFSLVCMSYTL